MKTTVQHLREETKKTRQRQIKLARLRKQTFNQGRYAVVTSDLRRVISTWRHEDIALSVATDHTRAYAVGAVVLDLLQS